MCRLKRFKKPCNLLVWAYPCSRPCFVYSSTVPPTATVRITTPLRHSTARGAARDYPYEQTYNQKYKKNNQQFLITSFVGITLVVIRAKKIFQYFYHQMDRLPYRKTKRLKGFDYSESGTYFITICTNNFKHYFGEVKNCRMFLIVGREPSVRPYCRQRRNLISRSHGAGDHKDTPLQIGTGRPSGTGKDTRRPFPGKLWQKNYYERIIDNEKDYDNIAEYIIYNPSQWLKGGDEYG